MVNFRLRNLDAMVLELRDVGISVDVDPQCYPNGRFTRLYDQTAIPLSCGSPVDEMRRDRRLDQGTESTGAERPADVNAIVGSQVDGSESAHSNGSGAGPGEEQPIRAGGGGGHGFIVGAPKGRHQRSDGLSRSCLN